MAYKQLLESLSRVEGKLAITSFGNPDPDAIASSFALGRVVEDQDIEFDYLFESEVTRPENQSLVNYLEMDIKRLDQVMLNNYEHISLVDCNPSRVPRSFERGLEKLQAKLLSIQDHHSIDESELDSLESKEIYVDIRPSLGATSTILAECLHESGLGFDEKKATALYYGLHSDTNELLRGFSIFDFEQALNYVEDVDRESLREIKGAVMTSETFDVIHQVTDSGLYEVRGAYKFANAGTLNSKNRAALPQVADLLQKEEGVEGIVVAGIDLDQKLILGSVRYSGSRYTAEKIASEIAGGNGSGGGHVEMGGFQIRPGVLEDTIMHEGSQEALMESIKERFFGAVGKSVEE